jgi:hypothetical protein
LFTSVDGGGCRPFFLRRILFIPSDSVVVTVVHFFEILQFSPYHIGVSYIGCPEMGGKPISGLSFRSRGSSMVVVLGLVLPGLICILRSNPRMRVMRRWRKRFSI